MTPDRSRIYRSPIAPKKSPCQVVPRQEGGGFARKCSSPVFTSSPSRPPDVRTRRLQAPDHHHQKENGHCGIARPPPPSPAAAARLHRSVLPEKPEASPKKILGERNADAVIPSKKSRKEWQIPSPSAIELKKSSVESPVEVVADQASSFLVNLEVLGEPLPVAGWVQERVAHRKEEESKNLSRNLFRDLSEGSEDRSARHASSEWSANDRVVFEEAASGGRITLEKQGMDRNIEDTLAEVTSAAISSQLSSSIVSAKVEIHGTPEVTSVANENQLRQDIRDSVPEETSEPISEVDDGIPALDIGNTAFSKAQEIDDSSDSSMRSWALGFLVLVALTLTLIVSRRQHFSELWRRQSGSFLLAPSFMEWSSEADTVGLYCNPQVLLEDITRMKYQLAVLYEKLSGKVVEQTSLSSVRLVSSYYSSLVLGNHAKDILFDYCHEFQGQYYRVRLATASLIEQAIPLEAAARDILQNWSFEDFLSSIKRWFSSAENYVNEALVYSYLHLPPPALTVQEAKESFNVEPDIDGFEATEVGPKLKRVEVAEVGTDADNQFSYASGWIGDSISVCEVRRPRSQENCASPQRVAETIVPAEVPSGRFSDYKLYLGVALASAILGAVVTQRIRSFSKAPQEKPQELELSREDIMRMRGAEEELILSPQQEDGSYSPYGSFTAYKRVVYNEGSENEHVRLTPVRRSSRIRNQVPRGFNS